MNVVSAKNLSKVYANGVRALDAVSLDIHEGEIFGLLGPNGAGKTTFIGIVAGLVKRTEGEVTVDGYDIERDYRITRAKIGLVQQELNADFFFTVKEIVNLQAGYFGIARPEKKTEEILRQLSLWEKRDAIGRTLSGGMKRRVMIAKALVHDPKVLFLDEPTAGVDVELRENMWNLVRELKRRGKTVILTTHYLEEAEELADRIGIINHGKLILVENKTALMARHGEKLQSIYLKVVAESNNKNL